MPDTYVSYEHDREKRWVRKDLAGRNEEFCLCHACSKFKPNSSENCDIVSSLSAFSVRNPALAIIWDCAKFEEADEWDEAIDKLMRSRKITLRKLA